MVNDTNYNNDIKINYYKINILDQSRIKKNMKIEYNYDLE